jgi:Sec-independent protein translocase protein TatA
MRNERSVILSITLLVFFVCALPARASELDELKATIQSMQKSMEQMQKKIAELERENHQQKHQTATSRAAPPRQSKRRRPLQFRIRPLQLRQLL